MHTLDHTTLLQFCFGHTTNTIRPKIGVTRLNASQTTQILVARFLPFRNQIGVGNLLSNTVIVQFTTDCLPAIKQIVNVSRFLVMNFEYWPKWFVDSFSLVRIRFSCLGIDYWLVSMDNCKKVLLFILVTNTNLRAFFVPILRVLVQSIPSHLAAIYGYDELLAFLEANICEQLNW